MSQEPNIYNSKKPWDGERTTERGVQGANDSLAYVPEKKYVVASDSPGATAEAKDQAVKQEPDTEQQETKYKKTDWNKRYNDLRRHSAAQLEEWKKEKQRLESLVAGAQPKYTPPKSMKELEEFKSSNPELYGIVESVAHLRMGDEVGSLRKELQTTQELLRAKEAEAAAKELLRLVPDYIEIQHSDDFHEWAEGQPAEIKRWVYENQTDANLAARAIQLYKSDRGVLNQKTETAQEAVTQEPSSADYVGTGRRVDEPTPKNRGWSRSAIARLTPEEYIRHAEEIDKAFLEGRISNS